MKADKTRSFNLDCIEFMQSVPDKFYDLAIVDPPYGINVNMNMGVRKGERKKHESKKWDSKSPEENYFNELFRISKNQIIWGANNFSNLLKPSSEWIYWDKLITGNVEFSAGELAFTSFKGSLKCFKFSIQSNYRIEKRIHPTQKPVSLYEWILINYAKEGDKILDTHAGSQSSRIACFNLGFELDIIELDKDYFDAGNKRFEQHKKQMTLF